MTSESVPGDLPNPLRVFIVEDAIPMQIALKDLVCAVAESEIVGVSGSEALAIEWAKAHAGHWDLAIVDLTLEQGDGFNIVRRLKQEGGRGKVVVFSAFVAPELLCTDRRTGMLGLYLASPLTRNSYLAAKAVAVVALLAVVTLGPPLLMLVAFTLIGRGPDGPAALLRLFGEMALGGLVVALLQASLSLAVSSTTTRKAVASAGVILGLLANAVVADALVNGAGARPELFVLNLLQLPFELVRRIYGEISPDYAVASIPTSTLVAAYVGWTVLFGVFTWVRYRRLAVDR